MVYSDDAHGAYSTLLMYPIDCVTIIPDSITDHQAAAMSLKGLTSSYLLEEVVDLAPGDTVLYHATAGGVGLILVQWAKAWASGDMRGVL